MLETLTPLSKARILNDWDVLDDIEACNFAMRSGGTLLCIVDKDNWARLLYDDGEFSTDRKLSNTPMFLDEAAAREYIAKMGNHFFIEKNGEFRTPEHEIVMLVQAAVARLSHHEAKTHEWGE